MSYGSCVNRKQATGNKKEKSCHSTWLLSTTPTMAEAQQERDREAELTAVCTAYFNANPGATEDEWRRDKTKLIAAFRQQRTLDALKGNESDAASIKTKLIESGKYQDF
jgi:hypothetical protein